MRSFLLISGILALVALGPAACTPGDDCDAVGDVSFVCGLTNAEDLVNVPDTPWIIASGMAAGAGFTAINSQTGETKPVPVGAGYRSGMYPLGCDVPPEASEFESHGLNLRAVQNGRLTLHAVGHGAREAIEIYDVGMTDDGPTVTWKGCVPMPDGLAANSVASFEDGSIVATVLFLPGMTFADAVVDMRPTGAVYRWKLGDQGFARIEGSELPANNGIEVSEDGEVIFVASSGFQTIVAMSNTNPTEQLRSSGPLPITPDNIHMGPDGKLLIAGMKNDVPECGGKPGPQHSIEILAACPRNTIALEIDPETMADRVLVETPALDEFSNATMVLPVNGRYWFGTFSGNRIANVPMR
jgi:hypothetical protein